MAKLQLDELYPLTEEHLSPLGKETFQQLVDRGDRRMAEVLLLGAVFTNKSSDFSLLTKNTLSELLKSAGLDLDEMLAQSLEGL